MKSLNWSLRQKNQESASDEERENFASLVPRPELYFGMFDAYVGDYGPFATHDSELPVNRDSQAKGDSKDTAAMFKVKGWSFGKGNC